MPRDTGDLLDAASPTSWTLPGSHSKQATNTSAPRVGGGGREIRLEGCQGLRDAESAALADRDQRPGLAAMMKAVNAKEFDMVRRGQCIGSDDRSPTVSIRQLSWTRARIFLHSRGLDTSTMRAKRVSDCLACCRFERGDHCERVNAGLASR